MNATKFQERQKKQRRYAESMMGTESFRNMRTYHCSCRTCDEHKSFHSAGTILDFLSRHKAHDTWIDTEAGTDALNIEARYYKR